MSQDWFISAITHQGSVDASLATVQGELFRRQDFITAIRANLAGELGRDDAVTELASKIRGFENTLRSRLGLLSADRPAAWFRATPVNSHGPFQSAVLTEPVFTQYDPFLVDELAELLKKSWFDQNADLSTILPEGPCLWRLLFSYKKRYEKIVGLTALGTNFRLDELPDGLPLDLDCRSLRAFLLNVRTELKTTSLKLEQCFQDLFSKSEELFQLHRQQRRERPQHSYKKTAEQIRDEFSRRRSEVQRILSPNDIRALSFMGFDELPLPDVLKRRYIAMAKDLHPDRQSGDESRFKSLVSAYNHLCQRLQP